MANMNYAQWYAPCPWSPPDHIWYPKREREATLGLVVIFEQSASLVTITDHNKLNHNKIPRATTNHVVPGEHMCWGPRKESSHRSGGWKDLPMESGEFGNVKWLQYTVILLFFPVFSCQNFVIFCFRCLPMLLGWLGHDCFHELIYHLRIPAG